ncbi:MAG: tetratricopeptide repeat protein [Candidatus Kapaibacterium sp.]
MKNFISLSLLILFLSITSLYSDKAPDRKPKFLSSPDGVDSEEITSYNGTKNPEAQKYYNSAVDAFRASKPDEAIELYEKAITEDPRFVEAYDNLGRVFRSKNMSDSAIYYYDKSLELFPKGVFANQNKAIVYFYNEDYDKAIDMYKHMIDIIPESPEGYYGLAQVYLQTLDLDEAIESVDKAIELYIENDSPLLGEGYVTKALIYARMEDMPNVKKNLILAKESGVELNEKMERLITTETEDAKVDETKKVLDIINWVLDNPMTEETNEKREEVLGALLIWTFKTDKVSIYITSDLTPADDCKVCLQIFSIGWSKYVLENGDKDDLVGAALYAVRTLNNYYITNREYMDEIELLEEFIELELEGKLKDRVTEVIESIDKENTQKVIVD